MMEKDHAYLAMLVAKGDLLASETVQDGVYYLYAADGEYVEVFMANKVEEGKTMVLLEDLERLADYGRCWWSNILGY